MPIIFVIHPNKEELSKVSHIMLGRDYMLKEFQDCSIAEHELLHFKPDACLMPVGLKNLDSKPFIKSLHENVPDCPVILLVEKEQINEAVRMVGDEGIVDYFLLKPIVDPVRLHMILDKALTQSAMDMHMGALKNRLSNLPGDLPGLVEKQSDALQKEMSKSIDKLKTRMKGEEFKDIINLLDEDAFDSKFESFKKEEIKAIISKNRESTNEILSQRMAAFTFHLQEQLDERPKIDDLGDLRKRILGEIEDDNEMMMQWSDEEMQKATKVNRFDAGSTVLFMDDEDCPTRELANEIEKFGHNVLTANSPAKLLEMAKSPEIDIIICGYNLGQSNGIEIVRRIREGLGKASLPIFLLTSDPTPDILEGSEDVGINEVVSLPLIPKSLESKIKQYVK